jgi:phospholipid/cholesterol/gamma-HCH transport system substrate-binding protein
MMSPRAGPVLEPGSKVTYNGVEIGKVARLDAVGVAATPKSKITLDIDSKYIGLIPDNVYAEIKATTVFGNRYVAFESPKNPSSQHISAANVIDVSAVTTEFNTLFETVLSVAEMVDPIKLNQTLTATAQALDGLGDRFGQSVTQGNEILADLNPQLPQIRYDTQRVADLISTSEVLDYNSPALFCSIKNFHDVEPKFSQALGGNGFSGRGVGTIMGAGNPYVYPDNLPRVNARGGPEGRPGCWQKITRDLWPAPYLVLDTGASIAPYNHFGVGQPMFIEYVWGRQIASTRSTRRLPPPT